MDKETLLRKIDNIPKFRMMDVAVKESDLDEYGDEVNVQWVEKEKHKAVTEMNSTDPICFVSSRYTLIQMKHVFEPIVTDAGDLSDCDLFYHFGFAVMYLFPSKHEFQIDDDNQIGLICYNSVDKSSAVNIRFCVKHKGKVIPFIPKTFPKTMKDIAGFKKVHVGKVAEMTNDYAKVITKIREVWGTIVEEFTKVIVTDNDVGGYAEHFKIGDNATKHIKKKIMNNGKTTNLWDFCMEIFDYLSRREYKSGVHKQKRMDKFVQRIFDYSMVIKL